MTTTKKVCRRAIPRGRIQPLRAGLSLRRTEISRSGSRMTESRADAYGYNSRNELTNAVKNAALNEYAYQYDDIGNRLSATELAAGGSQLVATDYTANNLNQYTSISNSAPSAGDFTPQYDLDGNQTLVKTATGVWSVAYNGENRPVSWSCGTTNIVMKYDRMGRRVEYLETVGESPSSVTVTNAHHRFVYDGYLCIQRLDGAANNAVDLAFGWDPTEPVATRPLWMQRVSGTYNFFYFHDGNKNVSDLVSYQSARGVPAHYEYAPFGAVTAATTNTAFTAFNVADTNPYRFSSEYADDALGLVYYNYRYYNPCVGRWLNCDPIEEEGGENLYAFCENNSVSYFDNVGTEIFNSITLKRKHLKLIDAIREDITGVDSDDDYWGHWWIELGGESYGWWPSRKVGDIKTAMKGVPGDLNGQKTFGGKPTKDPHHGETADEVFHPQRQESGTMKYGVAKGIECNCTTENDAKDCIRKFAKSYSGEWRWPVKTCQTFQLEAMSNCCLKR